MRILEVLNAMVSFGLKPALRQVLNSVFLAECTAVGLDSAIVHASKILPLSRIPEEQKEVCRALIYDEEIEGENALNVLLRLFEDVKSVDAVKEDRSDWTLERVLKQRIIDAERDGLTDDLNTAMAQGIPPLDIINNILLEGMKVVGELFGSGQMQLPFVLQSAETMKTAVAHLEPFMEKVDGQTSKGRLVLATVKGDVHDIGKNLVDIICTNNGYEVVNMGIKVSIADMIAKVQEVNADALGMSGLLVKSTLIMRENLQELNAVGLSEIPVILGGAALTRTYVEKDLREVYDGRVARALDALAALDACVLKVAALMKKGKEVPELREMFGIVSDFTQEEEAEILLENSWAFE
jgi:5-methyltetrahydrofolate--homocysteine methyltransferase